MRVSKGKYIFSDRDVWNLDNTLSKIIVAGLIKYKNSKRHGYPSEAIYDYHLNEKYTESEINAMIVSGSKSYDEDAVCHYWESCIDKMIFSFQEHPEYYELEQPITEPDVRTVSRYRLISFIPKQGYSQADVDEYNKRESEYDKDIEERKKEGRSLFLKYYDSLWD